jgi:hypothetical protein
VAPSTNRKGGQIKTIAATPLNALPHHPPMGWMGCTINWQKSMPSLPHNWWSAPAGAGLTWPLARFMLGTVGRSPPRSPLRQRWHHHHQLISRPRLHRGNGASPPNPKLTDRLAEGTGTHMLNAACGTHTRANAAIGRDTVVTPRG